MATNQPYTLTAMSLQALQQRLNTANAVAAHIDAQERDVLKRIQDLHTQLALVHEQREEHAAKMEGVREEVGGHAHVMCVWGGAVHSIHTELHK